MTILRFDGADIRDLIDVLIEAVRITSTEGERPSVEVHGKAYAAHDLLKVAALLPHDEDLQEHHQAKVAALFVRRQRGYLRTAYNLANRANGIAAEKLDRAVRRAAAKGVAERLARTMGGKGGRKIPRP
jgi:hypothetical protein